MKTCSTHLFQIYFVQGHGQGAFHNIFFSLAQVRQHDTHRSKVRQPPHRYPNHLKFLNPQRPFPLLSTEPQLYQRKPYSMWFWRIINRDVLAPLPHSWCIVRPEKLSMFSLKHICLVLLNIYIQDTYWIHWIYIYTQWKSINLSIIYIYIYMYIYIYNWYLLS